MNGSAPSQFSSPTPHAATHRKRHFAFFWWLSGLLLCIAFPGTAWAQSTPAYVYSGPLLPLILQMPANSWLKANTNLYSDVWTPPDLEPLDNGVTHFPSKIIEPWSGFGWDSNRGDLILYGGGHANYSGNDVYRWHSSTLTWERASLPSEIYNDPVSGFHAIDGVDSAPSSAHTYDNNQFLPIADRFLTWGGAAYNSGGPYLRVSETDPTATRAVGPYLFNPNRADGNKVGGITGSHVMRVAPHPEILGGQMWENRDIHLHLAGQPQPGANREGCAAAPVVEAGRDVVYLGATNLYSTNLDLYRYQLTDITNPALDQISKVGAFWNGTSGLTTCGYDPVRKLFVRIETNATPFLFWDLTTPGPDNLDKRVEVDTTIAALQAWLGSQNLNIKNCALKFDPVRKVFPLWCGAAAIWVLNPPASGNTTSGWTVTQMSTPPPPAPPGETTGRGVLGKWRYAPFYDVFVGLEDINEGHVWIYKPAGWVQPNPVGNALPTVTITAPANGTTVAPGTPLNFTAAASDSDGSIARVEYYVNGVKLGQAAIAPYVLSWTPSFVGSYSAVAIAVDNVGGMTVSPSVNITVSAPLTTVTLQRGLGGYAGVSDTFLDATATTTVYGAANPLYLDSTKYTPLLRFAIFQSDGGSVPNGAVIQSAELELYKQYYDDTLQLNALQKPWVETQATWQSSQTGIAWSVGGAAGAGTDYNTAADAQVSAGYDPGWVAFDVASRVQQWSNSASGNYGWRLTQTTTGYNPKQFNSSEYAVDTTLRPKLTVVYAPPPANMGPTVALTTPLNGASTTLGGSFVLTATAGDVDGTVTVVEYFANGGKVGQATTAPYSVTWVAAAVGTYVLTARATDNSGATTTSNAATVTVTAGTNMPPTVALTTPQAGASTTLGGSFALTATAGDADGSVTLVEYFANGGKVGQATTAPYSVTWVPSAVGSYVLTARATDNAGASTTSAAVGIVVNPPANVPPVVSLTSPVNGTTVTAPATVLVSANASDSDGSVVRVDFYAGATLIGSDSTAPYSMTWSNVAAGSYSLTAVAVDNAGASTTSAAVGIVVNPPANVPPVVSLTSPVKGTTVTAPATVLVSANASDSDGSVVRLDFYVGSTLIGSDSTAPYSVTWSIVAAGNYSLTAVAVDNLGARTTSSPVTIKVNRGGGGK
jgi:hypothetical protein